MASGYDMALAGLSSKIEEQESKKEAAGGTVQVQASGYDVKAIAQVNEYVNIRDAASEDGEIIGQIYNNSAADILAKSGDWYLVKSGDVTGYVKAEYFVTGDEAEALAEDLGTEVATVNTETLMVRKKASKKSKVIAMVGDSQTLEVLGYEGNWVKVAVDSDVVGYVAKKYVDCDTEFVEAESIEKVDARADAVQAAYDQAEQMLNAAVEAMNNATADEANYAAYMASQAAAEAKQLAAEQEYDYDLQELAQSTIDKANEAAYAAVMAEEAQAAAEAEAAAAAEAEAQQQAAAQAEADAASQAAAEAAAAQAAADAAAQAAAEAQQTADEQGTAEAQQQAEQAASEAATAQAEADAAMEIAEATTTTEETSSSSSTESTDASTTTTSGTRQAIVNFALQFVGNPYVYGGTSLTNGADCSGFTQSVMANFGISISRTAGAQSVGGREVSLSNIQPGDLLFYSGSGDYGIGHVSMYIGNGQVVHASNSRTGIIVSDIGYRTPCSARSYID
jgi:cell wall-associated NlpC family hydrolase/SH3-like domain-containing protein